MIYTSYTMVSTIWTYEQIRLKRYLANDKDEFAFHVDEY